MDHKDVVSTLEALRGGKEPEPEAGDAVEIVEDDAVEASPEAQEEGGDGVVAVMEGFEFLKNTPLFHELNLQEMKSLFNICETRLYGIDDVVIEQDKPGQALFIIKEGKVKVERLDNGLVRPLTEIGPGSHVGEMSLIDDVPTSAQVTAVEATEVFAISRVKFDKLMATSDRLNVKVTRAFIRTLNDRLRKTSQEFSEFRRNQEKMLTNLFPES